MAVEMFLLVEYCIDDNCRYSFNEVFDTLNENSSQRFMI